MLGSQVTGEKREWRDLEPEGSGKIHLWLQTDRALPAAEPAAEGAADGAEAAAPVPRHPPHGPAAFC